MIKTLIIATSVLVSEPLDPRLFVCETGASCEYIGKHQIVKDKEFMTYGSQTKRAPKYERHPEGTDEKIKSPVPPLDYITHENCAKVKPLDECTVYTGEKYGPQQTK